MNKKKKQVQSSQRVSELQESFAEYLKSIELNKILNLCPQNLISFHWSNWDISCRLIKDGPLCLFTKEKLLEDIQNYLEDLKDEYVWLSRGSDTIKGSKFDLYQFYLDPRIRQSWNNHSQKIMYSSLSEAGPYSLVNGLKWKDHTTYSYFVFQKILEDNHPLRKFRLTADIPVILKYDQFEHQNIEARIKQISHSGVLLKYDGFTSHFKLKRNEKICLLINQDRIEALKDHIQYKNKTVKGDMEFWIPSDVLERNLSADNSPLSNGTFYVFVSYEELGQSLKAQGLSHLFYGILNYYYKNFIEVLDKDLSTFHSWVKKIA